jgi:hypothetical protein
MLSMRRGTILTWFTLFVSLGVLAYLRSELLEPMTGERYTSLCGEAPDCHPEVVYVMGLIAMDLVAIGAAFRLALTGLSWLVKRLVSSGSMKRLGQRFTAMRGS